MRKWLTKYLVKRGKAFLLYIFVAIPVSLLIPAIVLFFSNVLFGGELEYRSLVK